LISGRGYLIPTVADPTPWKEKKIKPPSPRQIPEYAPEKKCIIL